MKFGYKIKIVYMLMGLDFYEALNMEKYLQSLFKSYNPLKVFGSYRECFSDIPLEIYKQKVSHLIPTAKNVVENLEITWR